MKVLSLIYDKFKHWYVLENLQMLACEFNQRLNYVRENFAVMELHRSGKDKLTSFAFFELGLTSEKAGSHY